MIDKKHMRKSAEYWSKVRPHDTHPPSVHEAHLLAKAYLHAEEQGERLNTVMFRRYPKATHLDPAAVFEALDARVTRTEAERDRLREAMVHALRLDPTEPLAQVLTLALEEVEETKEQKQ